MSIVVVFYFEWEVFLGVQVQWAEWKKKLKKERKKEEFIV